jgi:hypothetical protein
MFRTYRLLTAIVVIIGVIAFVAAGPALAKAQHHRSGQQLLGNRIKANGQHEIDKVGEHRVSVNVVTGKVAGVSVKHTKKGDVPVKKYKTRKKLADTQGIRSVPYKLVQYEDLGTTYIGYAFVDDSGDEWIYWFPYEMILDGDTGAVEYVPLS